MNITTMMKMTTSMIIKMVMTLLMLNWRSMVMSKGEKACEPCGDMAVPYPLSTNPSTCGHPSYRIYCNEANNLEFRSRDGLNYIIQSINAAEQRMVIKQGKIVSDEGCFTKDVVVGGLYLDEESPFNISSRNTVMLLNCSDRLLLSPLNCSNRSVCHVFVDSINEARACRNKLCCSFLKDTSYTSHRIRVHEGGCTAYTSVVSMDPSLPPSLWSFGVEMQWIPPSLYS